MENGSSEARLLHTCHVHKSQATITKFFTFFYSILLFSFISFRLSSSYKTTPLLPWLLVFSSELFLSFLSLLNLSFRWLPVSRATFPERLSNHEDVLLPAIDVFVFTADPKREPAVEVMNTVISAMALDYPPEMLAVYISDDGGSPVMLAAAKEAVEFARWWVPFCRKYEIVTRCPKAYFGGDGEEINGGGGGGRGFMQERRAMEDRTTMTLIGAGEERNGIYWLRVTTTTALASRIETDSTALWHSLVGHPSLSVLQQ